ncbi:MAG: polysaccharide biosynthesis tyrosine autokinase, partial [Sphingobacteriales bacterium]
ASTMGTPIGEAQKQVDQLNTQKTLINVIRGSLASPESRTLPTAGISDGTLSALVGSYNQAVLKRQSLVTQVAPNSMLLKDLDDQIKNLKAGINDNLTNNLRAIDLQASTFVRQGSQFRSSVSVLPEKQRVLNEISREKSIKESLYMYLLQKREETALSKTTTTPYEQIDLAASYGPVSPDKKGAYLYAGILGLALPIGIIFLIGLLNDKVSGREEVENAIKGAQVVGEINHIKRTDDVILPALKGGIVGEQFRIMRANLNFLQHADKQVILVTSSASGEGKSFVSLNLAAVLSKTGKKVALLDFDLRKPDDSLPANVTGKGIKDYLLGEAVLEEIAQPVGELPNLHLFPSGSIIAEVGDLILGEKTDELFAVLQAKYDCVVVNTPPAALVGDALILQRYSTIVGYVIREGKTKKKHLKFLNSLLESRKFNNTCIIYNGVKTGMKYGYYGYGYT